MFPSKARQLADHMQQCPKCFVTSVSYGVSKRCPGCGFMDTDAIMALMKGKEEKEK